MTSLRIRLLALDLEATLVDNAMSGNPRPGLHEFLAYCDEAFEQVALLTTVDEDSARDVLEQLADRLDAPERFVSRVGYIHWSGEYKDLNFATDVSPAEILFVDDDQGWVHPNQIDQWIAIQPWHGGPDTELKRVQVVLEDHLRKRSK